MLRGSARVAAISEFGSRTKDDDPLGLRPSGWMRKNLYKRQCLSDDPSQIP